MVVVPFLFDNHTHDVLTTIYNFVGWTRNLGF